MSSETVEVAKAHQSLDYSIRKNLTYLNMPLEEFVQDKKESFDVVTSMEVIEHIEKKSEFLKVIYDLQKPGGHFFTSTMSKSTQAKVFTIDIAENVAHIVPPGTHNFDLYINAEDLSKIMSDIGFEQRNVSYTFYNPVSQQFFYTDFIETNYLAHYVKV